MIEAYDLEQQITEQQDAVDKAGKKYNNLVDDGQSLEKKRKDIEKDIEDNKKDQEKQSADIEKQKLILETLKGKRKQ
jgi:chromosome segregation ATPase